MSQQTEQRSVTGCKNQLDHDDAHGDTCTGMIRDVDVDVDVDVYGISESVMPGVKITKD
jgi:hypothetical protein